MSSDKLPSLAHRLLGPATHKCGQGQDADKNLIAAKILEATKGSKFYEAEKRKDIQLQKSIDNLLLSVKKAKIKLKEPVISSSNNQTLKDILEKSIDKDLEQLELSFAGPPRVFVHVDADAFYASVELLDNPQLADIPFAVAGSGLSAVVNTCNYIARSKGVKSAMAVHVAKHICPELTVLPTNFKKYKRISRIIFSILKEYDPNLNMASLDEAYMEITQYLKDHNITDYQSLIHQIRERIHKETLITVSAGIGPNARIAKVSSNLNKPNGQYTVLPHEAKDFLRNLPIRKIHGIGRVLERKFESLNVKTAADFFPNRALLALVLSPSNFQMLSQCYLGLGSTDISPYTELQRKSIGTEETFSDIYQEDKLKERLWQTACRLAEDMRPKFIAGKILHLKLKLHNFTVLTRQLSLPKPIHTKEDLYKYGSQLLEKELPICIRLMGLKVSQLESIEKYKQTDIRNMFKKSANFKKSSSFLNYELKHENVKPSISSFEINSTVKSIENNKLGSNDVNSIILSQTDNKEDLNFDDLNTTSILTQAFGVNNDEFMDNEEDEYKKGEEEFEEEFEPNDETYKITSDAEVSFNNNDSNLQKDYLDYNSDILRHKADFYEGIDIDCDYSIDEKYTYNRNNKIDNKKFNEINKHNGSNELNELNKPDDSSEPSEPSEPNEPNELNELNKPNELNELNKPNEPNELNELNELNEPNEFNDIEAHSFTKKRSFADFSDSKQNTKKVHFATNEDDSINNFDNKSDLNYEQKSNPNVHDPYNEFSQLSSSKSKCSEFFCPVCHQTIISSIYGCNRHINLCIDLKSESKDKIEQSFLCPICDKEIEGDMQTLNSHIDACLSKKEIINVVQDTFSACV